MSRFEYGLFFLFLFANICITGSFYPALYFAVAMLHETGHILCMKWYGYPLRSIRFVGFGIAIDRADMMPYRRERVVCLAGPLVNLFLSLLSFALYARFGTQLWQYAAISNLLYGLFNLLPIAPLDGYKILMDFVWLHCSVRASRLMQKGVCFGGMAVLAAALAGLLWYRLYNFSLIFIVLILLFNEIVFVIKE